MNDAVVNRIGNDVDIAQLLKREASVRRRSRFTVPRQLYGLVNSRQIN
ncbi:hypothetical protein [Trinickia violacea]|nr:hypothetical protein [Trinickia violacea]